MTPTQKIKATILIQAENDRDRANFEDSELTAENVDTLYQDFVASGGHWDYVSDMRCGEVPTPGIGTPYSRHYECEAVAYKMFDGTWVGWTYWHGGGKHGDPGSIPWMEDAYFLDCEEQELRTTHRIFKKSDASSPPTRKTNWVTGCPNEVGYYFFEWKDPRGGLHVAVGEMTDYSDHRVLWLGDMTSNVMQYLDSVTRYCRIHFETPPAP